MVESIYEAKFYKSDFSNVDRPGVPIVLAHNSSNHYAPTVILNREEYAQWQLELVGKIGKCFLNVIHEVDVTCIKKDQRHHPGVMQSAVSAGVTCITGTEFTPTTSPAPVLFAQQPAAGILTRFTEAPSPSIVAEKQKGRNPIVCEKCGYTSYRKTDMNDHMLTHSGKLPTCQIGECHKLNNGMGRKFKFGRNLKAHIKNKHQGVYHYNCEKCDYSTNNKGYFETHKVKHHGEVPEQEYICNDCGKTFDGHHLLKRHQRHGMCTTLKNFTCQICEPHKMFKSHGSLVIHIKRFHTGEIPLELCPKCNKEFASKESLKAHNIIHIGLELLKRAKRNRQRMEQNLAAKNLPKVNLGKCTS